jgi:hypothetical protein
MPSHDAAAAGQAPECQFCPLCQAMAALRSARPDAVEHLLKAGAELLLAARALLEGEGAGEAEGAAEGAAGDGSAARPRPARGARPRGRGAAAGNGLQHIDVG